MNGLTRLAEMTPPAERACALMGGEPPPVRAALPKVPLRNEAGVSLAMPPALASVA